MRLVPPWLSDITSMMAVIPMTMPSTVKPDRDLLVFNPPKAVAKRCWSVILLLPKRLSLQALRHMIVAFHLPVTYVNNTFRVLSGFFFVGDKNNRMAAFFVQTLNNFHHRPA